MTLGGKTTGALGPHHSLLVGFAGILRGDHRWLDTETDLDLVHEYLDPPAQLIDPFGGVVGLLLHLVQLLPQVVEIGQVQPLLGRGVGPPHLADLVELLHDLRQGHGRTSFTRSRVEVVGRVRR
jgi:hypothetical protein